MKNLLSGGNFRKFSSMFLILSLLVQVGVFLPLNAEAITPEQIIFEDGFESTGGGFLNWTSGNPESGKWTADNSAKVGGDRSARVKGANDINKTLYKEVSTVGFENIKISYWYKIDGDLEGIGSQSQHIDHFYVEWWDGTNWNELMHLIGPEENGWIQETHNLNVNTNDNPDFKLRFRVKLTAATESIYIDDVKITGTEIATETPTGTIHITKYECPVGTNLTRNANGPALDGSHTAPEDCDTKSGAYFSYENSNPGTYPGLDGSYLPIPGYSFSEVMGETDANGVLEATVPYISGKAFNVAETDSDGVVLPSILALYCNGDTDTSKNDNYEQIPSVGEDETKYCVAYNEKVEEPLICDPNINLIENGDFETPVVTNNAKWDIFPSGTTGLGWLVEWFGGSATFGQHNRPETALLELHRGVNSWNTSGGEGNLQYAELDSDWFGPNVNVQNEPASIAISQDIPTIPGKNYKLTFDFSPRPYKGNTENVLGVSWGGVSEAPISAVGGAQTIWTPHTFNFVATTSITKLMFKDLGISNSEGTFLDNVKLTCENEATDPCTYADEVFYSDTNHMIGEANAVETWTHANWVSTTSPAKWIWKDLNVQNPTGDEMYTFTRTFNLTGVPTSNAVLSFAADNSYKVVINGNIIASTTNEFNFGNFVDLTVPASALVYGVNTIEVTVHNWALNGGTSQSNPAGFIYALYVNTKHCPGDNPYEPNKLQVKIYKYLDGKMATNESANGYSFPMNSAWSWPSSPQKQGSSGSGDYFLNQAGEGGSGPYTAYTSVMNAPATYSTYEVTNTESGVLPQSVECVPGRYRLVGYKVGGTLSEAENSDLMTTNPSLTNLNSDTHIIVYNETCTGDTNNGAENGTQIQALTDDTGGTTPPGSRRRDISNLFARGGQVLGASTDDEGLMCEPYLKEYIKLGGNNNPEEVKKLQIFLNQFFELDNPVTGFYGPITFEMVKKFQAHQEAGTLTPWLTAGVPTDGPTGYVYKTTKRWINILKCPETISTSPMPQLP